MVMGDASSWAAHFISIDERLLGRIIAVWPDCLAVVPANATEDVITINLIAKLSRDREARAIFHFLDYQHEPFSYSPDGLALSKGKIDMAVLLDQERERYLAYECKRLNVTGRSGRQSLAVPYVMDGVTRFIRQQYAGGLPVGCMLGYVMDSDISFALSSLGTAINNNSVAIGLTAGPLRHPHWEKLLDLHPITCARPIAEAFTFGIRFCLLTRAMPVRDPKRMRRRRFNEQSAS